MDHLARLRVDEALNAGNGGGPGMPELSISAEKVAFLIEKAREFDVKEARRTRTLGPTLPTTT
jgi:hypothetical protein